MGHMKRQVGGSQERKEQGRCEELQEGPVVAAGGERSRADEAGPKSLMEGLPGFLRTWDFIPTTTGSQCRVLNGDRLNLHLDIICLLIRTWVIVWGLEWQEVGVAQGII